MVQSVSNPKTHSQVCGECGESEFTGTDVVERNGVVIVTAYCLSCGAQNIMNGKEAES